MAARGCADVHDIDVAAVEAVSEILERSHGRTDARPARISAAPGRVSTTATTGMPSRFAASACQRPINPAPTIAARMASFSVKPGEAGTPVVG